MTESVKARRDGGGAAAAVLRFASSSTVLPYEHGSWILFLAPLAVGLGAAWAWNLRAAAFAAAALALFFMKQPAELAWKILRGKRPRADLFAPLGWLAAFGLVAAVCGWYLILVQRLGWLVPMAAAAAALLALQAWAAGARLARTVWSEVLGTTGLALAAGGAYYAATGVPSATVLVLWALMAAAGIGGVLYSRWRLRRRRLAARQEPLPAPPRATVLLAYCAALALVVAFAAAWLTPRAVAPLYALLLARAAWGSRPSGPVPRSVMRIGMEEGLVTLAAGAWIILAYRGW